MSGKVIGLQAGQAPTLLFPASEVDSVRALPLSLVERLLDDIPNAPFFVADSTLRFVRANTAMADLCGAASSAAMAGRKARDYFPHDWRSWCEADRQALHGGQPVRDRVHRARRNDGEVVWTVFHRWPLPDAHGAVCGVVAIGQDLVTPERRKLLLDRLSPVVEYIQDNFAASIDVTALAARAGVSISQLDRDFINVLGLSPTKYQQKLRLEHAQDLLLDTTLSIAQIAGACGYSDQSSFTRAFGAAIGSTPRDYRRGLHAHTRAQGRAAST